MYKTRIGWLDGEEVVDVWFDPDEVSYESLLAEAKKAKCARTVFARTDEQRKLAEAADAGRVVRSDVAIKAQADQDKYHLRLTTWRFVPMSEAQACRVNAALAEKHNTEACLSPRQIELKAVIDADPRKGWTVVIGAENLIQSWMDASSIALRKDDGEEDF